MRLKKPEENIRGQKPLAGVKTVGPLEFHKAYVDAAEEADKRKEKRRQDSKKESEMEGIENLPADKQVRHFPPAARSEIEWANPDGSSGLIRVPLDTPIKVTQEFRPRRIIWTDAMKFQVLEQYLDDAPDPLARPDPKQPSGKAVYRKNLKDIYAKGSIREDHTVKLRTLINTMSDIDVSASHMVKQGFSLQNKGQGLAAVIDEVMEGRDPEEFEDTKREILERALGYMNVEDQKGVSFIMDRRSGATTKFLEHVPSDSGQASNMERKVCKLCISASQHR